MINEVKNMSNTEKYSKMIKVQKILRFIPIINFFSVFLWIHIGLKIRPPFRLVLKQELCMFAGVFATSILNIIVTNIVAGSFLAPLFEFLFVYSIMFVIAFVAVKAQEEIIKKSDKKGE